MHYRLVSIAVECVEKCRPLHNNLHHPDLLTRHGGVPDQGGGGGHLHPRPGAAHRRHRGLLPRLRPRLAARGRAEAADGGQTPAGLPPLPLQ